MRKASLIKVTDYLLRFRLVDKRAMKPPFWGGMEGLLFVF
ncbi:MAG: hypothetical protein RL115_818 [Bacteroidota bacterium]